MRKKGLFLILFIVLFRLTISVSSSFAQDIDVSNMDNAQLMSLLQEIMRKLENDAEDGSRNGETDQLKMENGELKIGEADVRTFRIYENKKLILERMPDYYFIRPQTVDEGDDGPSDPGKKKEEIDCSEYCTEKCIYDLGDVYCTADCLAYCLTELSVKDHH